MCDVREREHTRGVVQGTDEEVVHEECSPHNPRELPGDGLSIRLVNRSDWVEEDNIACTWDEDETEEEIRDLPGPFNLCTAQKRG